MTIEQRFREAAAALVAVSQDQDELKELLTKQGQQLAECRERAADLSVGLDEGRAVVLALLENAVTGPGLGEALAERAREWLREV